MLGAKPAELGLPADLGGGAPARVCQGRASRSGSSNEALAAAVQKARGGTEGGQGRACHDPGRSCARASGEGTPGEVPGTYGLVFPCARSELEQRLRH